jgi:hypothetical protein
MGLSGEVALLRQAQELGAKATDNALAKLEKSIDNLSLQVSTLATGLTEPAGSPAGRALQRQIDDHGSRLDDLERAAEEDRDFGRKGERRSSEWK